MLAEWYQAVGQTILRAAFVRSDHAVLWRMRRSSGQLRLRHGGSISSPSRWEFYPSASRRRLRADDPMFVAHARAGGRETRSYNFGVFAYLFNSLFHVGRRLRRVFHDPTGRLSHLYFEICLTTAPDRKRAGRHGRAAGRRRLDGAVDAPR
jgi:hypothetical protein